ncbi:MAG: hypothetical protein AAF986_06715, partial [Pseudomonadota bacterium]
TVGADHFPLQRSVDYYITHALETVRLSGGMWGIESGHHTGFVGNIRQTEKLGSVLTGCYADYLFKGLAIDTSYKKFLGRTLPLSKLAPIQSEYYLPYAPITHSLDQTVTQRRAEYLEKALANENRYLLEQLRLFPLSREGDASGRLALWRQLPIDPIFADDHVLDAYSVQSIPDKLSGLAFGEAIARVTGPVVASIPNNNYSAPVGTGALTRVTAFTAASLRRKAESRFKRTPTKGDGSVSTDGAWPDFSSVLQQNSQAREWFSDLQRNSFYGILDEKRQRWDYDTFIHHDTTQLTRLLTFSLWRNHFAVTR